ncbi:MAG: SMI1/KNR4 family protein [Acidobacteria bacterium]|nr:SMI1/KNR4 family protein [Acidobacteriota bacterium]
MPQLIEKLVDYGVTSLADIRGCSALDISRLEDDLAVPLPETYKEFLVCMGRGAGRFLNSIDIYFESIVGNQRAAAELLKEDKNGFVLSEMDFVFAMNQGYEFMYFDLKQDTEDPAVYYYIEGSKMPEKKFEKFSDFLIQSVKDFRH